MKTTSEQIFEQYSKTTEDIISGEINSRYIVDYGIVDKVNADETVNVVHVIKKVLQNDAVVEPYTLTKNVEVLWPSSAQFSVKWALAKGDRVLLLGLKNLVPTVDVVEARRPAEYHHYSQETLKAVPMCVHNETAQFVIEVEDGQMIVKNQINSLASVLDELMDALTTGWISINCVVGAPVTPLPSTLTAINAVRTKLATLFKD